MKTNIEIKLKECAAKTEEYLRNCYDGKPEQLELIFDAEKYSLLAGGKRIRAFLTLEICRAFGKSDAEAAPFACAVEMVHAYSLIHDDLPCMDDDDYRRGKLTNHKVYGEAVAVLAGDALLTKAFEIAASNKNVPTEVALQAVLELSRAAGDKGMVGGQILDIKSEETREHRLEALENIHRLKTGAMIKVSAVLGGLAAGVYMESDAMRDVITYAENIGYAFQIVDDVLDVIGDSSALGKNTGSDKDNNKLTYMSFYSVEEAMELAKKLTDDAIAAISKHDGCDTLVELAKYLLARDR